MLNQSTPPEGNEGPPIKPDGFMLVWIQKLFICVLCSLPALGRAPSADGETRNITRDETMTKKQRTGLVFMLGSVAAGIQLTIFSPVLRGWVYSICLGVLVIAFAGGADLFRGNE
jgi:hypothetical protein